MIGTAIFLDLISLIPGANWVSTLGSFFIFPLWFLFHGIPFFKNPKNVKRALGGTIIEAIPVISVIPALSFVIIQTVISYQKEYRQALAAWENAQTEYQTLQRNKITERRQAYNQLANEGGTNNQVQPSRRVDSIRRPT